MSFFRKSTALSLMAFSGIFAAQPAYTPFNDTTNAFLPFSHEREVACVEPLIQYYRQSLPYAKKYDEIVRFTIVQDMLHYSIMIGLDVNKVYDLCVRYATHFGLGVYESEDDRRRGYAREQRGGHAPEWFEEADPIPISDSELARIGSDPRYRAWAAQWPVMSKCVILYVDSLPPQIDSLCRKLLVPIRDSTVSGGGSSGDDVFIEYRLLKGRDVYYSFEYVPLRNPGVWKDVLIPLRLVMASLTKRNAAFGVVLEALNTRR